MPEYHPFLPFLVAALLAAVTRGTLRSIIMLLAPVVGGLMLLGVETGIPCRCPEPAICLHLSHRRFYLCPVFTAPEGYPATCRRHALCR